MPPEPLWPWLLLGIVAAKAAAELVLNFLNLRELDRWRAGPPAELARFTTPERFARAGDYARAKLGLASLEEVWGLIVLGLVLASGVLPASYAALGTPAPWKDALWAVGCFLGLWLASLWLDAVSVFRIEARFSFNRTTPRLWLADQAKSAAIGLVLGVPPVLGILLFVEWIGSLWWLYAAALLFLWQVLLLVLYPRLILPLFNKLTPLPPGEVRERLAALCQRAGFPVERLEVIDGSKRSGHSNAFFTGFGKARQIVLFDTLLRQLDARELEAVVAHEVGHYKLNHIPQRLVIAAVSLLALLLVVAFAHGRPEVVRSFGFAEVGSAAPALVLVTLAAGALSFWLSAPLNQLSRRHEYEANEFAARLIGGPEVLEEVFLKLQEENLSNLVPHPLYTAVHASHPPLKDTLAALAKLRANGGSSATAPSEASGPQ